MSKPRPDNLLKFGEIVVMLVAEVFAAVHAGRVRRRHPNVCLALAHTTPPMCAHSGLALTHCNGRRR